MHATTTHKRLTALEFKLFQTLCKIDHAQSKTVPKKILLNLLVSGGRDSMSLLHAVSAVLNSRIFQSVSEFTLIVTHFNHKKRGQESDEDALFVLDAGLKLGIEGFYFEISKNKKNAGFQNFAREERRRLAVELCEQHTVNGRFDDFFVFTAHHAQDHVESVLMHLIRGAGIAGLQGFYGTPTAHFLKPFAEIADTEIQEYALMKNIGFRTDSSNLTDNYDRNFLRHHILPRFKTLNPNYDGNILRFSKHLKDLCDRIQPSVLSDPEKDFVFLPETTSTDLYFYFKSKAIADESEEEHHRNSDISENSIQNILHEVELFRQSSDSASKIISLKNNKKLTLYKRKNDENKIFASL